MTPIVKVAAGAAAAAPSIWRRLGRHLGRQSLNFAAVGGGTALTVAGFDVGGRLLDRGVGRRSALNALIGEAAMMRSAQDARFLTPTEIGLDEREAIAAREISRVTSPLSMGRSELMERASQTQALMDLLGPRASDVVRIAQQTQPHPMELLAASRSFTS